VMLTCAFVKNLDNAGVCHCKWFLIFFLCTVVVDGFCWLSKGTDFSATTLAILSQPTDISRGVSRPVKSRSYRHSGGTDDIYRCCYKCYQRSQITTENNAEPSFQHRINCLCQFTGPPPGHMCQPHLCGRGLRQCPANPEWPCLASFCRTLAASQTFPTPYWYGESTPTTGARPLPQTRPFWLNQPVAGNEINFSE